MAQAAVQAIAATSSPYHSQRSPSAPSPTQASPIAPSASDAGLARPPATSATPTPRPTASASPTASALRGATADDLGQAARAGGRVAVEVAQRVGQVRGRREGCCQRHGRDDPFQRHVHAGADPQRQQPEADQVGERGERGPRQGKVVGRRAGDRAQPQHQWQRAQPGGCRHLDRQPRRGQPQRQVLAHRAGGNRLLDAPGGLVAGSVGQVVGDAGEDLRAGDGQHRQPPALVDRPPLLGEQDRAEDSRTAESPQWRARDG